MPLRVTAKHTAAAGAVSLVAFVGTVVSMATQDESFWNSASTLQRVSMLASVVSAVITFVAHKVVGRTNNGEAANGKP